MWKDFFYYSKSERRVILLLLVMAILLLGVNAVWKWAFPAPTPVSPSESAEIDSFLAHLKERDAYRFPRDTFPKVADLRPFDPNTVDSSTLRALGLPAFIARNVLRYREKGGTFRTPEAFARIYGLSEKQYRALRPYIVIAERFRRKDTLKPAREPERRFPQTSKFPEGTVVDLNRADTSELKQVPGIGSGLARLIVAYRRRLGGFCKVSQLQEVPYAGKELNKWFRADGDSLRKLRVNRDGLDRLRAHPYMDFYKAKVILEYRRKRGDIKGVAQLSMFEEFSEADIARLLPYLSFE